jgi:lipoprotein-releasing system permease protein
MVLGVFAVQGFVIGLAGVSIGSAVGYALAAFLRWWEWKLDTQVYYLDSLPVIISPLNFLVVGISGLAITFVAGLLPSIVAARQRPVAGLQYD